MWAEGAAGWGVLGWGGGGGLESGSKGRAREGRQRAGEVEREPSLHHPSPDSSACCFGKKVMINAKVTAIP